MKRAVSQVVIFWERWNHCCEETVLWENSLIWLSVPCLASNYWHIGALVVLLSQQPYLCTGHWGLFTAAADGGCWFLPSAQARGESRGSSTGDQDFGTAL